LKSIIIPIFPIFYKNKNIVIGAKAITFKYNSKFNVIITTPSYTKNLDFILKYNIRLGKASFRAKTNMLMEVIQDKSPKNHKGRNRFYVQYTKKNGPKASVIKIER